MFRSYDTKNMSDLCISGHNTKLFEQSITYNGVFIYDKLSPHEIKSVKCIMKCLKMIINFYWKEFFILWKNLWQLSF